MNSPLKNNKKNIDLSLYTDHLETSLAIVGLKEPNILEIRFKIDQYEVGLPDQEEIQNAVEKLTNSGKKRCHIMVIPGLYGGISNEARQKEIFINGVYSDPLSISIIVSNLSQRLLGKFYLHLKKQKPKFPFQLFGTEAAAVEWIKSCN